MGNIVLLFFMWKIFRNFLHETVNITYKNEQSWKKIEIKIRNIHSTLLLMAYIHIYMLMLCVWYTVIKFSAGFISCSSVSFFAPTDLFYFFATWWKIWTWKWNKKSINRLEEKFMKPHKIRKKRRKYLLFFCSFGQVKMYLGKIR